jgi:hypothetical protein
LRLMIHTHLHKLLSIHIGTWQWMENIVL